MEKQESKGKRFLWLLGLKVEVSFADVCRRGASNPHPSWVPKTSHGRVAYRVKALLSHSCSPAGTDQNLEM